MVSRTFHETPGAVEPQPNRHRILQEAAEEAEKCILPSIAGLIQNIEQKVTKRTKRVNGDENWSSLPSFPSVKPRKDRIVSMALLPPVKPIRDHLRNLRPDWIDELLSLAEYGDQFGGAA